MAVSAPASSPVSLSPLAGLSLSPSEPTILKETVARRQLKAELFEIKKLLEECGLNDDLTKELRTWCTCFCHYVTLEEVPDTALDTYIPLLREILIDPLTLNPLGDEPLLGSDGRTYNKISLAMYFSGVPEQFRCRSPKEPNNETSFTTKPHLAAIALTAWLKKRGSHPRTETRQYQDLSVSRQLPIFVPRGSNSIADSVRYLRAIQEARSIREDRKEHKSDIAEDIAKFNREASQIIADVFAPVHAKIEQVAEKNMQRIAAHNDQMQEHLNAIAREIERLDQEIEELRKGNEELNKRLHEAETSLAQAQNSTNQLENDIRQIKHDIAKKKHKWLKELSTAVLVIGACAFTGWALTQVLIQAGAAGTTVGMQAGQGAMKFGISIAF